MPRVYFFIIAIFLYGCYKVQDKDLSVPFIENIPSHWTVITNEENYTINDFWPTENDSTLFYLLKDFNKGNEDMLLLDINASLSEIYYGVSKSDLYPQVSISNSVTEGKQNLSAFGLSDDVLSEDSSDGENGIQEEDNSGGGFITFSNSIRLNTVWELDLWNRIKDSKHSFYYKMESDFYDIEYAKASLRSRFIKLYFQAISLNKEIQIYEDNLANLLALKEISEKRALEGISGYDEIYLASSKYYLYESTIISLKYNYNKIISQIELLSANYLDEKKEVSYSDYLIEISDIPLDISSNLLERRPDIISSKNKVISDRLKLKSDKKIFFPRITFNTSAGYSSSDLGSLIQEEFSVWGLGLDILTPVFNGGKIKNNIKIAEYNLEASELEYIKTAISAIYEVDEIILEGNSLNRSYEKLDKSEKDMQKALKYALNSYDLGLVDLIYVLNIQESLNTTSIKKNRMVLSRYINRIDLILSLGGNFEY